MAILNQLFDLFLIPLSFLPSGLLIFFDFVTSFFVVFLVGKLLRWLWDILPMV